ncbi:MAG: DUF6152 family protein [Acidobacteria bacterium]|nr:DUF6152 family protein [Acidobacteriota bacterium]
MRTKLLIGVLSAVVGIGLGLAGTAEPVAAHHAFAAEFDAERPVEFSGKVTRVEGVNPHVWIHIDVELDDGTTEVWAFEGGTPNVLFRRGFTRRSLLPGTDVRVDGYQAKDGTNRANGRDITFPDGTRLFLGSSGTGAPYELARPGVDTVAPPR